MDDSPYERRVVSIRRSTTLNNLFFGRVMTFAVARPNVKPAVIREAEVENTIKELMLAVGNGPKIRSAGSKVISVEAAAASAFHISPADCSTSSFPSRQSVGIIWSMVNS